MKPALHLSLLGTLLVSATAAAEPAPQPPWFGSGEGRAMYSTAADVKLTCPLDDTAGQRARIDAYAAAAAAAKKDDVRAEFGAHAKALRAWFDKHLAGVPGVGTWAELDAFYKQAYAAEWALPRNAPEEEVLKNFKAYVASAENAPRLRTIIDAIYRESPCQAQRTRFEELAREVNGTRQVVDRNTQSMWATLHTLWTQWRDNRPPAGAAPSTYWEHAEWVMVRIDDLAQTATLRARIAEFATWAPKTPQTEELFASSLPAMEAALAAAGDVVAELAQVELPPLPRDGKRRGLVAEMVTRAHGRTVEGDVYAQGKTSKQKWTEKEVVKTTATKIYYRNVPYEREWFTAYYAWKPTGKDVAAPDLPGMPATEICEVWAQNVARMNKGDPTMKRWYAWQSWRGAYLPCANIKKVSKRKLKKS